MEHSIHVNGEHLFSRGSRPERGYDLDVCDDGLVLKGPDGRELFRVSQEGVLFMGRRMVFADATSELDEVLSG